MNLREQKESVDIYNNYDDGNYDDDGFYSQNYNDEQNVDTQQYYDNSQYDYVDTNDYYPKEQEQEKEKEKEKKSRFVRPRPKHKAIITSHHQQQQHQHKQEESTSFKPMSNNNINNNNNNDRSSTFNMQKIATAAMLGNIGSNIGTNIMKEEIFKQIPPGILSLNYYKYYFRVHNEYVLSKLGRLLLPFLRMDIKEWKRKKIDEVTDDNTAPPPKIQSISFDCYTYQAPIYDINAPDGYLPLMAIITYIVIMGFVVGTRSLTFSPQILIATGSSAFIMLLIEVLLMKIGFYLIGSVATPPYWLDIVCYTGYKLVFVTINLIINLIFDSLILYYIISITTGIFAAIFMIQTLRPYFRDSTELQSAPLFNINSNNEPKKTRKIFLGIVGIAQIFFIQLMGRYTSI